MSLNVFNWAWRPRYYLTHPWKWIKELFSNIHAAYRRARYGWCYMDVWELGYWLLEILPPMLRHMAEHGCGYPGNDEFPTYESWQNWLKKMANDIESVQESNVEKQNEYEEDFHKSFNMRPREKENEADKFITITWNESPDHKEISKKYFERMKELTQWREVRMVEIFTELARKIPTLWD